MSIGLLNPEWKPKNIWDCLNAVGYIVGVPPLVFWFFQLVCALLLLWVLYFPPFNLLGGLL